MRGYLDHVAKVTTAQAFAGTRSQAMAVREEIAFFQAVRVCLIKLTRAGSGRSRLEKEVALRQLVAKGELVDGVNDIFATLGLGKPDISLLDEDFLKQIREMPTKNLAAELLERLLADQVKARGQKNAMQGKEFTQKLEEAIAKYQNRKDSRARMMAMIKVLLAKHKYPPDKQAEATEKVIAQAELLADTWSSEQ